MAILKIRKIKPESVGDVVKCYLDMYIIWSIVAIKQLHTKTEVEEAKEFVNLCPCCSYTIGLVEAYEEIEVSGIFNSVGMGEHWCEHCPCSELWYNGEESTCIPDCEEEGSPYASWDYDGDNAPARKIALFCADKIKTIIGVNVQCLGRVD